VSKIAQFAPRELRKSLCFGGGSSRKEEAIVVKNVGVIQENLENSSGISNQGWKDIFAIVSAFSPYLFHSMSLSSSPQPRFCSNSLHALLF